MAWEEAQYVIDEVLSGLETSQITGIPPKNMSNFSASPGNGQVIVSCSPPGDTIIDGQVLCTVAGVKVIKKVGSAPKNPEDGTLILDVPRGRTLNKTDTGLSNGVTYYYGFFPYSDHGVYNYNQANIKSAVPSQIKYWAFDQNFADKNPASTISYPAGFTNSNFAKMHTNDNTGTATAGGWLDFLQNTLKNYPFMVGKNGVANYALNPADYTKKKDGSASDYNNKSYNGGAFAWLNKIYMREDYSSNGETRRVQFANSAASGFYPIGFYDTSGAELEGLWLPMGYLDTDGTVLIKGTRPISNRTIAQEKVLINNFSSRGAFLGGPILNVLRDLEYMMFKTTNIQLAAGYGCCNAGAEETIVSNNIVPNGSVPGWKGTNDKKSLNKYFHSQVLGSYQIFLRDPYTLLLNGKLKVSDHYIYDLSGANLNDTGINYSPGGSNYKYPCHLIKVSDKYGSIFKLENTGTSSTGLCDGINTNVSGTMVCVRLGNTYNGEAAGPGLTDLARGSDNVIWSIGATPLLLPNPGYKPTF